MDEFTRHFEDQAGGGSPEDNIGVVFRSGFANQKGRGVIGNLFRGLWSYVSPLFKSGVQSLGKEALHTGTQILSDATQAQGVGDFKTMAKRRMTEGRDKLVAKMRGAGRRKRSPRLKKKPKRKGGKRKSKRKMSRTKLDIFSGFKH